MQHRNTIRWGMIGCGSVTEKKSGPPLYKAEHSALQAVFSPHHERAVDYARRHNVPVVHEQVDALLADPDIDVIYIPTPPNVHKEYAIRCLEAGKIPYIEKPMAMNLAECQAIMDKAREVNLPVYVAFYRRGLEKYKTIKTILERGDIGTVRCVHLRHFMPPEAVDLDRAHLPWRLVPHVAGGGKFVDMVSHVLDVVDFLFGRIVDVQGMADNKGGLYDVEDTVSATFRCASGVMGSGLWCYVADHAEEEMLIIGDKGRLITTGLFYGPVTIECGDVRQFYAFEEPEHIAQPYVQSLVNELTGHGPSDADTDAAVNGVCVLDEILREYRKRY